jgi:hypothetical protein
MAFAASTAPGFDHIKIPQTGNDLVAKYASLAKQEELLERKVGNLFDQTGWRS